LHRATSEFGSEPEKHLLAQSISHFDPIRTSI
jgi:hypothetical protein